MTVQYGSISRVDAETPVERALRASTDWLLRAQTSDGYWVGNVDTNSCMEAEWLLTCHILKYRLPIADGVIRTLLNRQRPDGSWDVYPGAPAGDINSTVERRRQSVTGVAEKGHRVWKWWRSSHGE